MDRKQIINMALEAGFGDEKGTVHAFHQLEHFANLVAASVSKKQHEVSALLWLRDENGKAYLTNISDQPIPNNLQGFGHGNQ